MTRSGIDLYDSNMRSNTQRIRSYALFGESTQLPDVMHCETIAARSSLHDWELAPHRHDRLHQLLLLRTGGGQAQLDDGAHDLGPMALVNVPPGEVHAFAFEPGTDGHVATLADEMLQEILAGAPEVRRALGSSFVAPADDAIAQMLGAIADEYGRRAPARALVLRGLCAALLGRAARLPEAPTARGEKLAESHLLARFESLLEAHVLEHWRVADYARALAVSPTHLSRVTRAATGAPASRLIEDRLLREARRQLAYTNLRVATVAYTLGFADPAHFSRVFARATGVAPRVFREQVARGGVR
jgi:AraC family transcriptional activator of pobA